MGLAILGVIVLVFIGLAVFSAKTWQIWHVLIVSALFIATLVFCRFRCGDVESSRTLAKPIQAGSIRSGDRAVDVRTTHASSSGLRAHRG